MLYTLNLYNDIYQIYFNLNKSLGKSYYENSNSFLPTVAFSQWGRGICSCKSWGSQIQPLQPLALTLTSFLKET